MNNIAKTLRKNLTDSERKLWGHLRAGQLEGLKFRRQEPIGSYVVDFVCFEKRLVIELDGGQHAGNDNKEYDSARSAYLKSQGIDMMRFWNHEVLQESDSVLVMIAQKITPPSPLTSRGVTKPNGS